MPDTQFHAGDVRASATTLAAIMSDMAAFETLQAAGPTMGSFPAAQALEQLVDDRRAGAAEYALQLQAALDDLHRNLVTSADELECADEHNAAQVVSTGRDLAGR